MFKEIDHISNPPERAVLVWDGQCGFCKYWVTVWKHNTNDKVAYRPFQEVSDDYPDIPLKEFKKASRLIESDGKVYSGPDSAFRSFLYFKKPITFPHLWYHRYAIFNRWCNHAYNWVAKNRPFMFKLTKLMWGSDPTNRKPFWLAWVIGVLFVALLIIK